MIVPLLGCVPNIKGLQITGNPIENIPIDVIASGFTAIIKYLKKKSTRESADVRPVDDTCIRKTSRGKTGTAKF
jgi:hypothetical protein